MSKVYPLEGNQRAAVAPEDTVWLSASAGTGKTQVLSSRVLRLLLRPGVSPSQILCLTFTKAGATEMAERINGTLAEWVRLPETELFQRLEAIGAPSDPDSLARARTLFASVLDCPGGGLRIDTIHAFAQWLLGAFPHEAGLVPGTRAMEDRERVVLLRSVLADLLVDAEKTGRQDLLDALAALSIRMAPEAVEGFLLRCAEAREAWFGAGAWQEPMRPRVNQLLGLPADADPSLTASLCADGSFDTDSLRLCLSAYRQWTAATGQAGAEVIGKWLSAEPAERLALVEDLSRVLFTKERQPKNLKSLVKFEEYVESAAVRVLESVTAVQTMRALVALAERLAPALTLGRAFALAWDAAKQREGLIDFDDQIRRAADLLTNSDYAQWIGYKLDRRFDHILVDEAQDTNAAQWKIIRALTQEFFTGAGQRDGVLRTLFVVGDYKQAIFRFQGTSPENFETARRAVEAEMHEAARNYEQASPHAEGRRLQNLGLDRSFRTAQSVLDFVDSAIAGIGHEAFGLARPPERHVGERRPGYVSLWRPIGLKNEDDGEGEDADEGSEGWLSVPERKMAETIALQVKHWMLHGFPLIKGGERRATPGDVMVLVRKRRELAGLIVARLHAHGVPVAGVDRLRLGAPLAVRDLVAALRFAAQPFDDLNLASLLVSPLIGWSQEQLLEHAYRDRHVRLWNHLRDSRHPAVAAAMVSLVDLLNRADYDPPQALLHWLLVGPWQGRRKLVARLGREANDPIDELLNAAGAYAATDTPSLVGFLNWFDAGEGELKREAGQSGGLVRVMTVHGSKGLQAPIVILADATGNPERSRGASLDLPDPADPEARSIPIPDLRREELGGRLAEHHAKTQAEEEQEHWRLLYVAMTRAEEALFIGGALGSREKEPAPKSWYAKLQQLFAHDAWLDDPLWQARLDYGEVPAAAPAVQATSIELPLPPALPGWLTAPLAPEPRPARPLAPSGLGEDAASDPPFPPGIAAEAARRGVLIHRLLERLPDVPRDRREAAAASWLARHAFDLAPAMQAEMVGSALAVLDDPRWADLFAPGALAEVPIAALVGERVIAGTIDRLVIEPGRIRIVDFKTARRPPAALSDVPLASLRQMSAYAAALETAYPGRSIEAALLYTAVPLLVAIPAEVIEQHKPALRVAQ
jgi:ATP-dependent helicase/nuclease subunit A